MLKLSSTVAAIIICSGLAYSSLAYADGKPAFEVTITNLTRAQAFTPILVASHRKGVKIFELGGAASAELATIAEGGDPAPLSAVLAANRRVIDVQNSGGLLMPGESVTVIVSARHGAKRITVASMLIPTNDSFIALNGVRAPKGGKTRMYFSPGYDAGSEPNDELCANIPGPVCMGDGHSPEAGGEGYVHISGGIHGIADLPAETYSWHNPTAKIVIKRVSHDDDD